MAGCLTWWAASPWQACQHVKLGLSLMQVRRCVWLHLAHTCCSCCRSSILCPIRRSGSWSYLASTAALSNQWALHRGTPVQLHTLLTCHTNNGQGEGVEVHACYSTHKNSCLIDASCFEIHENSCLIGASCLVIRKNSCLIGASCLVIQKELLLNWCLLFCNTKELLLHTSHKNLPDTEHSLRSNDKGRTFWP